MTLAYKIIAIKWKTIDKQTSTSRYKKDPPYRSLWIAGRERSKTLTTDPVAANTKRYKEETAQEAPKIVNHDLSNIHGVKMDDPQTKPNLLNQGKTESPVQSY